LELAAIDEGWWTVPRVTFKTSRRDALTIARIAKRAAEIFDGVDELSLNMDLSAVHANGCPLRLRDLLDADRANFSHDIRGIICFLDRETGKLHGCFRPRCAVS